MRRRTKQGLAAGILALTLQACASILGITDGTPLPDGGLDADLDDSSQADVTAADGGADGASGDGCVPLAKGDVCRGHCGKVLDNCGAELDCPNTCDGGVCEINCGCTPEDAGASCARASVACGPASNNCGQIVTSCGACSNGTGCTDAGVCCPSGPSTACTGKCNTTVIVPNCGQYSCGSCPVSGDVCQTATQTCCTPDNTQACATKACGPSTNNCGQAIPCPNTCVSPQVCGSQASQNACCLPGKDCTTNAACCAGETCHGTVLNDGGMGKCVATVCKAAATTCSTTADCCHPMNCVGGLCQ